MYQVMVLVLLVRDGYIYLGLKKQKIGAGKLMAPGGKLELVDQDDLRRAAVREVWQECRVRVRAKDLKQVALLHIRSKKKKGHIQLHVFMTSEFTGEFRETKELGKLAAYPVGGLDYSRLMPADSIWLSDVLLGLTVEAWVSYDNKRTCVLSYRSRKRSFD